LRRSRCLRWEGDRLCLAGGNDCLSVLDRGSNGRLPERVSLSLTLLSTRNENLSGTRCPTCRSGLDAARETSARTRSRGSGFSSFVLQECLAREVGAEPISNFLLATDSGWRTRSPTSRSTRAVPSLPLAHAEEDRFNRFFGGVADKWSLPWELRELMDLESCRRFGALVCGCLSARTTTAFLSNAERFCATCEDPVPLSGCRSWHCLRPV